MQSEKLVKEEGWKERNGKREKETLVTVNSASYWVQRSGEVSLSAFEKEEVWRLMMATEVS